MERITDFLEDMILTEKDILPVGECDRRVTALRDMTRAIRRRESNDKIQEAMTTAHFTQYFTDALSRMFLPDYSYVSGTWREYTSADAAPDFRDVKRFRMTEPGHMTRRREKAPQKATYVAESMLHYGVEEYSEQFDISWQTLLNDDLGKLKETPARMARTAARFEDMFVSALYDNATTQAAMIALGVAYGGTGRLTAPNLAIAINAFATRTDANGNQLNFNKLHLIIPPILVIQSAQILKDLLSYGGPAGNVLADYIAGVHVDPYIATAAPNVPWYMTADPGSLNTITVARLQGFEKPWVYKLASNIDMVSGSAPGAFGMGDFHTGDIQYAMDDIIGGWDDATYVGVTDFHGFYYSSGTTP